MSPAVLSFFYQIYIYVTIYCASGGLSRPTQMNITPVKNRNGITCEWNRCISCKGGGGLTKNSAGAHAGGN